MSDAVQQIKDRLNIIDVVSGYVELHQAGKHFKGKSPFAKERTPSFYVSPTQGMYYCFSTNQGGDIFTFVQAMEGVDFKDALRILAEKANVELVPEAPGKKNERDRQYAILAAASQWYGEQLVKNPTARTYLSERGVSADTIAQWQIGYAPGPPTGGWRELRTAMHEQGYTDAELLAVGLIKQPEAGKEPFDVFRDRVMFPMSDAQGRVVAFSGRILHPSDKAPKYVNSPETALYKKSELLFGYHRAKHNIRSIPFWLIAEGQFDVIMTHQAGYTNAVAVSGTALTTHHVQQLERLCQRVVLALDGDRAGVAAMQKAATIMLARGLDVKVAALPAGSDPADLVAANVSDFKRCIGESTHIIEFLLTHLHETSKDERTYKLRVREELLPFLVLIGNKMDQEHFISVVAERTNTTKEAIRHEVSRLAERAASQASDEPTEVSTEPQTTSDESTNSGVDRRYELLTFLYASLRVIPADWQERVRTILAEVVVDSTSIGESDIPADKLQRYIFIIERDFARYPDRQQAEELADRLNQLRIVEVSEQLRSCREQLAQAERAGDEEAQKEHLATLQAMYQQRSAEPYTYESILPTGE